jgi:hypothetical protein
MSERPDANKIKSATRRTFSFAGIGSVLAAPFISRLIFKDQKRTLVRLDKISETTVLQDLSRYKRNFETDSGLQTRINAKVLRDPEARTRHYHVTTVVK